MTWRIQTPARSEIYVVDGGEYSPWTELYIAYNILQFMSPLRCMCINEKKAGEKVSWPSIYGQVGAKNSPARLS